MRANLSLLPGACVEELIGDDADPMRIRGVQLRDGRRLFANTVLLAAGALHSPRLLQRYLAKLDAIGDRPPPMP